MKKILIHSLSILIALMLMLPTVSIFVSAESYVNQSAAGERKIYEGVPEPWNTKNGYKGFYTKYVMVYGIPVFSTDDVPDWVLFRAYDVMEVYLRKIYYEYPEIINSLIENKSNVIVVGEHEYNIEHPDWTSYEQSLGETGKTERRGGGGLETTVLVDDLGIEDPNNWFSDFCGLVHEFTHTVLGYGIGDADHTGARPDIFEKINDAYKAAYKEHTANGKYNESVYDMTNYHEYFAGQVGRWFNANGTDLAVKKATLKTEREQLAEYDPAVYEICEMLFGEYDLIEPWGKGTDSMIDENEVIIDYSPLANAIAAAKSLDESMFDGGWDEFSAAVTEAQKTIAETSLTKEKIISAKNKLLSAYSVLTPKDGNLAYLATPSTTFVSSWESLAAVNDGKWSQQSNDTSCPHYGSWGNLSNSETVTYTWDMPVKLTASDLYIWTDNYTTNSNIAIPASYIYEYLGDDGEWHEVEGADDYSVLRERGDGKKANLDGFNLTNFTEVTTTAIRVTLNKSSRADYGVGIVEWRVYGTFSAPEVSEEDTESGSETEAEPTPDTTAEQADENGGCSSSVNVTAVSFVVISALSVCFAKRKKRT